MFGFVTFIYKEKGKVPGKFRKQKGERVDFSSCGSPTGLDARDPFDLHQIGVLCDGMSMHAAQLPNFPFFSRDMELGSIILDLDLTDNAPDMQLFYCEVRASNLPTNLSITCLITTLEPALSRQGDLHTSLAGIDEKGSSERTMDDAYVSDEEFHVPFLPQLSPRGVIISRRYILDLALKKLGLTIESTKVIDARDGEMYASMSLHLSADKSRHASEPRMFHGDYAGTKENAIEAASSAVLAFLKDKSMIYVDDGNYHELKACQHKLLAASSWAMLFEDHSSDLKEKMSRMSKEVEDDDQKIDVLSNCQDANNACPLPLVILLLFFIKSFLLYIDAATRCRL